MGSRDVQKADFVRALPVIGHGAFHRISHFLDSLKIDSLDHHAVLHIQTGDNPFCQHLPIPPFPVLSFPLHSRPADGFGQIDCTGIQRLSQDSRFDVGGIQRFEIFQRANAAAGCQTAGDPFPQL